MDQRLSRHSLHMAPQYYEYWYFCQVGSALAYSDHLAEISATLLAIPFALKEKMLITTHVLPKSFQCFKTTMFYSKFINAFIQKYIFEFTVSATEIGNKRCLFTCHWSLKKCVNVSGFCLILDCLYAAPSLSTLHSRERTPRDHNVLYSDVSPLPLAGCNIL